MASWHSSLRTSWTLGTLLVGGTVVLQRADGDLCMAGAVARAT